LEYDENTMNMDLSLKRRNDQTVVNLKAELFDDISDPIYVRKKLKKCRHAGMYVKILNYMLIC
jgi:hypothetical protein